MKRVEARVVVARALRHDKAFTIFDLMLRIDNELSMGFVGEILGWLVEGGYAIHDVDSSTVGPVYHLTSDSSLSDLCRKLLPNRDPVVEGHQYEATRGLQARTRTPAQVGADLDKES